jgi:transcription elongation factor Elf1
VDRSCLQCGTLHKISSTDRMAVNDKQQYKLKCNSCGYNCEAPLLPFHPTNINSIRSGTFRSPI